MTPHWILPYLLQHALFAAVVRTEEVFNTTPPTVRTSFSCRDRPMGFYADVEANCRVYHTCDDHGNRFSYRCPEETAFRQDALICDHAHLVACRAPAADPPTSNPADKEQTAGFADTQDNEHRPSFSRSFQVVRPPDRSAPDSQPGFVFRSSLFLRDQDRTRDQARQSVSARRNDDSTNRPAVSTARTPTERANSWNPRHHYKPNQSPRYSLPPLPSSSTTTTATSPRVFARNKSTAYPGRSFAPTLNSSPARVIAPDVVQRPPPPPPSSLPREKSPSPSYNSDYHPYSETLKSIQTNARVTDARPITTEIPVHALTVSLRPLVPNELEYDPYYPKQPTSTEAYYTPSTSRNEVGANDRRPSINQAPSLPRPNLPFEIPSVLPDLNTLEDLLDRRKLFYIPRTNAKSRV